MRNELKFLLVLVAIVVVPLAILLGIYLDILPSSLQVAIGLFGVVSAIAIIVGGNLYLMWDDIKSGRYSKRT
jgi:membrane protease YdiL (CAAX protease family)